MVWPCQASWSLAGSSMIRVDLRRAKMLEASRIANLPMARSGTQSRVHPAMVDVDVVVGFGFPLHENPPIGYMDVYGRMSPDKSQTICVFFFFCKRPLIASSAWNTSGRSHDRTWRYRIAISGITQKNIGNHWTSKHIYHIWMVHPVENNRKQLQGGAP